MKAIISLFTISTKVISFLLIFFGTREVKSQSCVPPASFSAANISATRCHNQSITFTNPNVLPGAYRFRFYSFTNVLLAGPITVLTNGTTTQSFPSGTNYKAVLIHEDAACKDSLWVPFNVDAFPAAPSFTNNGPKCANTATGFNVTGPIRGLTYSWTFGDLGSGANNSATGTTSNHVYPIASNGLGANYNVVLTATSLQGCATSGAGVSVVVKAIPKETYYKNTDIKFSPSKFSGKRNSGSDFEKNISNGKTFFKPPLSFKNNRESKQTEVIRKHVNSKTQENEPLSTSSTFFCPPNIDFEDGSFNLWKLGIGDVDSPSPGVNSVTITTSPQTPNRHEIINNAGSSTNTDPFGGFSINPPDGSNFAIKLGNTINGAEAERATYLINVPPNSTNYSIIYQYAVVFEDPGHLPVEQPRFTVNLTDAITGLSVPCGFVEYISSASIPGFFESSPGSDIWCKNWTPVFVNLSKYSGRTLNLEFTTADCTKGGHWGYAYLDVNGCRNPAQAKNDCQLPSSTKVKGPPGFISYKWWNNDYSQLLATGQNASITPTLPLSDSLHLELLPQSGAACRDTIVVRIERDTLILNKGTDKVICSDSTVKISNGTFIPDCIYAWSSNIPINNPNQNTVYVKPMVTTDFILSVMDTISKCKSNDTIQVKVNPTPNAEIYPNTGTICSGNFVQFTNNSSPGLTYNWQSIGVPNVPWSNNTNQFIPGPTPPINTAGIYLFKLSVKNPVSGCKAIDTAEINVIPSASANWSIGPLEGCDSLNVLIEDFSQDRDSSRVWFDNGGVLTIPKLSNQINIRFLNPDTVNAYLVSYGKCSSDTTQLKSIRIRKSPFAGFSISTDNVAIWPTDTVIICKGEQVQFTNLFTGTIGVNHDWNFGDGPIGSAQESCSHIYNQEGLFEVKLKEAYNTEPNCPKIVRKWVKVNPLPFAGFNGPLVVCQGATVTYTNTSQNYSFFTWYLINGTTIIDSVQNVSQWSFYAPLAGNYLIRLKALNSISSASCFSILEKPITVQLLPLGIFTIQNQMMCLYDSLKIINLSQGGLICSWFLGSSNSLFWNGTNPTPVRMTTGGQNSVILKVQNPQTGCLGWDTVVVSVNSAPRTVARFQVSPLLGCDSLKVVFKDLSSFSENSIGVLGNEQYIQFPLPITTKAYTYPDTGHFQTRIIAQGICNTDTSDGPMIRVFPTPKADFRGSTAINQNWVNDTIVVCVNDTVRFKNLYSNQSGVKHLWYFEESNSFSSLINPATCTFLNHGIFKVRLKTISDSGLCTREKTKYVRVKPLPSISLVTQPPIVCENSPILLKASATTNAEFFRWQINESGVTSQFDTVANELTFNFLTVGLANTFIKLIAYNSLSRSTCFSEITRPIVVKQKPKPAISLTDSLGCAPLRVKFSRTSESFGSQETVLWSFGDNRFSTSQDLQLNPVTYQNSDSVEHVFKIKLGVKYDGCQDSSSKIVRVFPVPQTGFNLVSGTQLEQKKARLVLIENIQPISSHWVRFYDFGDGNDTLIIGGRNDTITHWYDTVGQYTLIQKVMDWRYPDTCGSQSQIFITVNQSLPLADFLVDGQDSSSICEDDSVVFSNTSRFVTLTSEWDFGNGKKTRLTGDQRHKPITIPYSNPGLYTIRLVVKNEKGKDTLVKTSIVQVNPKPDTRFKLDPEISMYPIVENSMPFRTFNQTTGGARFFWNFGEFPTDTLEAFDTTYKYTIPGEYTISLVSISDFGCLDTFILKPTMEAFLAGLWVPDVFSPGSSVGKNQYWQVFHRNAEDFEAIVYNQWGEQIFYTKDLDFKWDGTFEGVECPNGSYNFVINYRIRGLLAEKGAIRTISKIVTIKR
jgi:gliding motility-associated-like protein